MSGSREPLARYIEPKVDEARLARQRDAIVRRLKERRRPHWPLIAVAGAVGLTILLFVLFRRHEGPTLETASTVVEAPSTEPLALTLLDGTRVVLSPKTRVGLARLQSNDIRLELTSGDIDLDVTHLDHRSFVVTAAGHEVRVLGTHFAVRLHPDERPVLEVAVFRGRVRVTRTDAPSEDLRVLGAGETWSTTLVPTMPSVEAGAASPADAEPPAHPEMPAMPTDSAPTPTSIPAATSPRPSAKELWAQAETARAARRFQDEAAALNALRLRHRSDSRAGLAAFELGRLRQDTLHDPQGAAEAFADAALLDPKGPFREDADARRVEALDAVGRREKCLEAKNAFVTRYPSSIHRQRLSGMCDAR